MPKDKSRQTRQNPRRIPLETDVEHASLEVLEAVQASINGSALVPKTKKEKHHLKRESLLEKIRLGHSPYSKSHERRLKRKAQEQIGTGVEDLQSALTDLHDVPIAVQSAQTVEISSGDPDHSAPSTTKNRHGLIGEGKHVTLTQAQRKRALKVEQLRFPVIRKDPNFSANPFRAIRAHATNTLIKHEVPL